MPSASNINDLDCQTSLTAHVDPQRVFPALSTLIVERDEAGIRPACAMMLPVHSRRAASPKL
jgi:hypothetical protein